jgi:hypothetical protein
MAKKGQELDTPNNKSERIMNGVNLWCSFYRSNPHRFCKDYLSIDLKIFQQILLYMMNISNYFMYIAARGQGKSFLIAIFCFVRCILYPGTQVCIASKTRSQGIEILEKVGNILMPNSSNLRLEIKGDPVINQANAYINFKNGSRMKVVVSNDSARHNRANCVVVDEFRMVDIDIINKVLRKFNTAPRQPKYLNKPEYAHLIERNKEVYLSSAWMKSHWSWNKAKAYCKSLLDDTKKYFICGLPYQLSIREGLLSAEQVADEMSESDFNEIGWKMEMETLWFGSSESCFFNFDDLDKTRKLTQPIYPKQYYGLLNSNKVKYPPKVNGEIRLLTMDIAVMGGSKNDATAIFIIQLIPTTNNQYIRNIIYCETLDGANTVDQSLKVRRMYDDFDINFVVMDTYGVGIGVYDNLTNEQTDDERGETYSAWSCINDENMSARCKDKNAPKIIYSIKASQQFNSDCAVMLRDGIKRGKVKLLVNEYDGKDWLNNFKTYRDMPLEKQLMFELPFYQTTALINELINLDYENKDGKIKIIEKSGMRKDRYSSLAMGYFISTELERELRDKNDNSDFSKYIITTGIRNSSSTQNQFTNIFKRY